MKLTGLFLLALVALSAFAAAADPPAWEIADAQECLQFNLYETARLARTQEPVVIPGSEVISRTRLRPLAVSSLRLFGPQGEVALQVDERDGGDTWAERPNGQLDPNDEIVFLANVSPNSVSSYRLYYGGPPPVTPPEYATDLQTALVPTERFATDRCDAFLGNSRFVVGVRSANPADARRRELGASSNDCEGSLTSLRVRGVELVDRYVPLVWTRFQAASLPPWEGLRLVAGPVRVTAVAYKPLTGVYRHSPGEWSVTWNDYAQVEGRLHRSFTIYADSPLIDLRDEISAREVGDNFTINYRFALRPPVAEGEVWERTRTIYLPEGEGARALRHGDPPQQVNAGWLGVADTRTGLGLAVYYEPETAYQAVWNLFYPWEPHWTPGTPAWERALTFFHLGTYNREVLAQNRGAMAFRLLVLNGENPEGAILDQMRVNQQPLAATLAWAPPWQKGTPPPAVVAPGDSSAETLATLEDTLAGVRTRFAKFPGLLNTPTTTALAEFQTQLAQIRALRGSDPASLYDRSARAAKLAETLRQWTGSLTLRRLELFEQDPPAYARGFTGYVEDTLVKVRPEGPITAKPARQATAELARDEYEGFQVVLVPGAKPVTGVTVEVSDLIGPQGARLRASHIRRYRVGFVSPVREGVAQVGEDWPDPLIPLPGCPDLPPDTLFPPEEQAQGLLDPDRLAPFWFTVHAPAQAPAGTYTGALSFRAPTGVLEVSLSVEVFDFSLPRQWSLRADTWFNMGEGFPEYYGSWCSPEELTPLVRFMDTYRVTSQLSWLQMASLVEVSLEQDGSYAFDFSQLKPFYEICLANGNWFSANLSCYPGWGGHFAGVFGRRTKVLDKRTGETSLFPEQPLSQEAVMETELWKAFWPAYERFLQENGWLDRCYLENCDEPPYGAANIDAPENLYLRKFHSALRELAPGLRLFNYGMDPSPRYHQWAEEYVDAWGPNLSLLEESKEYLAEQTRQGKPFVAYICGPGKRTLDRHVPGVLINEPAVDLRIMPWMVYKYGGAGVLYYSSNSWVGGALQYVEKVPEQRWPAKRWNLGTAFGLGWFTYPAPRMKAVYPSARLENLRDGLEDYEYLAELERRLPRASGAQREQAQALLNLEPLVKNVLVWSQDPRDLRARRAAIARALESLDRGAGR